MKNHELLDLIGDVNEDYVRAADSKVVRPRFRWKAAAACAACAVLALGISALPAALEGPGPARSSAPEESRAPSSTLIQRPGLHEYLLKDAGYVAATQGGAGGLGKLADIPQPDPAPGGGAEPSSAVKPTYVDAPAISQEEASAQYDRLLRQMGGVDGREPDLYPDWFGGMWLDNDWPDSVSRLTVAIVDSFRTPDMEDQVKEWCGGTGDVLFTDAKYSQNHLNSLMDGVTRIFKEQNVCISSAYGVYVMDNFLGLDFYGEIPSDETLSALAELDPDGDAIRVQVFAGGSIQWTDDGAKGASCDPGEHEPIGETVKGPPVPGGAQDSQPAAEPSEPPNGGGQELPEKLETEQPAQYDLLPRS